MIITNATGGSYRLVLQNYYLTAAIPYSAPASTVKNALTSTAGKIPGSLVTTTSFSVSRIVSPNYLQIDVTFLTDSASPLTLLQVLTYTLLTGM